MAFFFYQKHGLTLSEKCNVWEFEKLCFCSEKKVCFLFKTLLNLILTLLFEENNEKNSIFYQKHGLTPLGKCDFWEFEKRCFHSQKKVSVLLKIVLNLILTLILSKNKL